MTFLSVNVNKFALIRNARDADLPNLYNISKKFLIFTIILYSKQSI